MTQGRLVIFEGADGVGKTYLARQAADLLALRGANYKYLAFPGRAGGSLGKLIYNLYHKPDDFGVDRITPAARQALHVAAHLDGLQTLILPSLEQGYSFVLDRFWWSTIAYGRAEGIPEATLAALLQLERCGWKNVQPDVVFLISRSHPLKPEPLQVWQQTVNAYEHLAEEEQGKYPIARIENEREPEVAVDVIFSILEKLCLTR